jgi:hypothetical protein
LEQDGRGHCSNHLPCRCAAARAGPRDPAEREFVVVDRNPVLEWVECDRHRTQFLERILDE